MRKQMLIVLIIFQCLILLTNVTFAEPPLTPKKIGVLELENKTKDPKLGNLASAAIMVHLLKTKSSEVIDLETLTQAFVQQGAPAKGIVDPAIVASIGKAQGLEYIIMGNVVSTSSYTTLGYWLPTAYGPIFIMGQSGCSATFEVMMVDVKTAQIVWTETYDGKVTGTTDLSAAIGNGGYQTARRIYKFTPLQGTIIKIDDEKIHIDLSTNNGITNGDLFSPVIPGIPSPAAGEEKKQSIILKVIEVGDTYCVAELKKGKAKDIQIGTTVSKHFRITTNTSVVRKAES